MRVDHAGWRGLTAVLRPDLHSSPQDDAGQPVAALHHGEVRSVPGEGGDDADDGEDEDVGSLRWN